MKELKKDKKKPTPLQLKLMMSELANYKSDYQKLFLSKEQGFPPSSIFLNLPISIIQNDADFLALIDGFNDLLQITPSPNLSDIETFVAKMDALSDTYCFNGYRERSELTAALGMIEQGQEKKSLADELVKTKGPLFLKTSLLLSFRNFVLEALKSHFNIKNESLLVSIGSSDDEILLKKRNLFQKLETHKVDIKKQNAEEAIFELHAHIEERIEQIENPSQWPEYDNASRKLHRQLKEMLEEVSKALYYSQVSEATIQQLDKRYAETCPMAEQELSFCYKTTFYAGLNDWYVVLFQQLQSAKLSESAKNLSAFYDVMEEKLSEAKLELGKNVYFVDIAEKKLAFVKACFEQKNTYDMYSKLLNGVNVLILKVEGEIKVRSGRDIISVWGKEFFKSSISMSRDEYELCQDYFSLASLKNDIESIISNPNPSLDSHNINWFSDRKKRIQKQVDSFLPEKKNEIKKMEQFLNQEELALTKVILSLEGQLSEEKNNIKKAKEEQEKLPSLLRETERNIIEQGKELKKAINLEPEPRFDKYTGENERASWERKKNKKIEKEEAKKGFLKDREGNLLSSIESCRNLIGNTEKKIKALEIEIEKEQYKISADLSVLMKKKEKAEKDILNLDEKTHELECHILIAKMNKIIPFLESYLLRLDVEYKVEKSERHYLEIEKKKNVIQEKIINTRAYNDYSTKVDGKIKIIIGEQFEDAWLNYQKKMELVRKYVTELAGAVNDLVDLYNEHSHEKKSVTTTAIKPQPTAYQLNLIYETFSNNEKKEIHFYFDGLPNDLLALDPGFDELVDSYKAWVDGKLLDFDLLKQYKKKFIFYVLDEQDYCVRDSLKGSIPYKDKSFFDHIYKENGITSINQFLCLSFAKAIHNILKNESGTNKEITWPEASKFSFEYIDLKKIIQKEAAWRLEKQNTTRFRSNHEGYVSRVHEKLIKISNGDEFTEKNPQIFCASMPLEMDEAYREVIESKEKDLAERQEKLRNRLNKKLDVFLSLKKNISSDENDFFEDLIGSFEKSLLSLLDKDGNYTRVRECVDNVGMYVNLFHDVCFEQLGYQKKWEFDFSIENIRKRMEDIAKDPCFEKDNKVGEIIRSKYGSIKKDISFIEFQDAILSLKNDLDRVLVIREGGYVYQAKFALETRLNNLLSEKQSINVDIEERKKYYKENLIEIGDQIKNKYVWQLLELKDRIEIHKKNINSLFNKEKGTVSRKIEDIDYLSGCSNWCEQLIKKVDKVFNINTDKNSEELIHSLWDEYYRVIVISNPEKLEVQDELRVIASFIEELQTKVEAILDPVLKKAIIDVKEKIETIGTSNKIKRLSIYTDGKDIQDLNRSCLHLQEILQKKYIVREPLSNILSGIRRLSRLVTPGAHELGNLSTVQTVQEELILSPSSCELMRKKGFFSDWNKVERLPKPPAMTSQTVSLSDEVSVSDKTPVSGDEEGFKNKLQ